MAPSSSGQDTRFSFWEQGFDSPWGHQTQRALIPLNRQWYQGFSLSTCLPTGETRRDAKGAQGQELTRKVDTKWTTDHAMRQVCAGPQCAEKRMHCTRRAILPPERYYWSVSHPLGNFPFT